MLQKIFGGDSSDEEESRPIRARPRKPRQQQQPTSELTETTPLNKTRKLSRDQEEDDQLITSPASTVPPPLHPAPPEPYLSISKPPLSTHTQPSPPIMLPPPSPERPKKPAFKPRSEEEEEGLAAVLRGEPPDKEDIALLRLALGQMKSEGEEMVGGVSWAYHPHDILSYPCTIAPPPPTLLTHIYSLMLFFLTWPTTPRSPAHQTEAV